MNIIPRIYDKLSSKDFGSAQDARRKGKRMIGRGKRPPVAASQPSFKRLFILTGTNPQESERVIGALILGLTFLSLGASAGVLIWALTLL